MDFKITIINANGCVKKGLRIGGMEIPKKRKDVRHKVIKDENPDLILIQESDIVLRNVLTEYSAYRDYQAIGGKDAGIIYDTTTFIKVEDPTFRLWQIYEVKFGIDAEILPRMCAVILKEKHPHAQPFLCVSWHGPYKINTVQKVKIYHDLLLLIKSYVLEKEIPVILGGDFNLDLSQIASLAPPYPAFHHVLTLHDYMTLDHRPNKFDYILTSQKINNVNCKPIDVFDTIDDLFPDFALIYFKAVLDHDPLAGNVTIPNQGKISYKKASINSMMSLLKIHNLI